MKKRKRVHFADSSWDGNYGDSYVPLCIGPNANAAVTYIKRQVTCKNCRRKMK